VREHGGASDLGSDKRLKGEPPTFMAHRLCGSGAKMPVTIASADWPGPLRVSKLITKEKP
jgi:hypothetical protein